MTIMKCAGFVGEIRKVVNSDKTEAKYFVSVSVPHGSKDNRKYQYMSLFVGKQLNRLFEAAFSSQIKEEDGKAINTLSGQIAFLEIDSPFFEVKDGYLNGTGILASLSFGVDLQENT